MQTEDHKSNKSPKSKRIPVKRTAVSKSTRRSQKKSQSPPSASAKASSVPSNRKCKVGTPRAIPKLLMSKLISPRSPRKFKPSTARSRRKSSIPSSLLNTALIPRNTSDKLLEKTVPTSQLLQSNKKDTNASEEATKVWEALKLPTTAASVLQLLENCLSKYEQSEILGYHEIYYIGIKAKKPKSKIDSKLNYGFDDDRGDYNIVPGDHIAYRYEVFKVLGSGSFGQVLLCKDHKTGQECAIKIIRNKTRFHQQALIEVEVLKLLTEKDCNGGYNVVHAIDNLMFRKHMVLFT